MIKSFFLPQMDFSTYLSQVFWFILFVGFSFFYMFFQYFSYVLICFKLKSKYFIRNIKNYVIIFLTIKADFLNICKNLILSFFYFFFFNSKFNFKFLKINVLNFCWKKNKIVKSATNFFNLYLIAN